MCQLKPIGEKDKCSIESAVDKVTIKKIGQKIMIQESWKRDELINQKNKAAKKEGKSTLN